MSLFRRKKDRPKPEESELLQSDAGGQKTGIPKTGAPQTGTAGQSGAGKTQAPQTLSGSRVKRLLSYQVANLQGVGARARQEDSFTVANAFDVTEIKEKGLLFVVCDGMGGMKDGKVASETAIASIRNSFV